MATDFCKSMEALLIKEAYLALVDILTLGVPPMEAPRFLRAAGTSQRPGGSLGSVLFYQIARLPASFFHQTQTPHLCRFPALAIPL